MYWYEEDVHEAENRKAKLSYAPRLAFYGSSSIRLWESIDEVFADYQPVNLGFGGSTLEACVFYFDRMFMDLSPEAVILYAGDNDLGDGKTPEQVLGFFKQYVAKHKQRFADIPLTFISIKPSIARQPIQQKIVQANQLISAEIMRLGQGFAYVDVFSHMLDDKKHPLPEYYVEDGLHLSEAGYGVWNHILQQDMDRGNMVMPEKRMAC